MMIIDRFGIARGAMSKRRTLQLAAFIAAGAILNIAIAWGCVLWPRREVHARQTAAAPSAAEMAWWNQNAPKGMLVPTYAMHERGFGYEFTELQAPSTVSATAGGILMSQSRWFTVGFPFRSLYGEAHYIPDAQISYWRTVEVGTFDVPKNLRRFWPDQLSRLPYYPRWLGFIANTVIYAAILWLPVALLLTLRRFRRAKRGLCFNCGYPIGTSTICTECGKTVKP